MKIYVEPELEFIMLTGAVICTSGIQDNTEAGDPTAVGNTDLPSGNLFGNPGNGGE